MLSIQIPLRRRLINALTMFVVALMSLVLLIYVAYGEGKRTYERFQIDKLVAQGQIVQGVIEGFVRPGLPMRQFVGFGGLTDPMVKADPLIDAIDAYNTNGERIFNSGAQTTLLLPVGENPVLSNDKSAEIRSSGALVQIVLPVRNRFEQVGMLVLSIPKQKLAVDVENAFKPVLYVAVGGAFIFAAFVFIFSPKFKNSTQTQWTGGAFGVMFLLLSALVVSTLISVYSQGVQARSKSLADSLGQRLDDLVIYNLNLDDVTGIIGLFGEYKRLNPDLRAAALIVDGKIRAHTDPLRRGSEWDHVESDYEYTVKISPDRYTREVLIKVALPREVVFQQVVRSVKNFMALFVASTFFAALFMGLARSFQFLAEVKDGRWSEREEIATINLVKPVFFLAVFVEHLSYAFLPTFVQSAIASSGLSQSLGSVPFISYYLCFAIALIPASRLEARMGARNVIILGLVLAAIGLGMVALFADFWIISVARAISGIGQGTLFIGVQAYVLANSSAERRTRAGGAIVFGFQAGMIAGMAIGSLLVSYLGSSGIFTLGAVLATLTALYGWIALPSRVSGGDVALSMKSAWRDLFMIMRNRQFSRTILLVGIPAKAVLTGVILFAMPLLLTLQGFAKEDIGQIIMIYACAVIASSHFAAANADRGQSTERILLNGTCLMGAGLGIIALVGMPSIINWAQNPGLGTCLIILGVTVVGISHGFINAPIVTHVTISQVANAHGSTSVAAAYRLLERIGHISGPLIMGQIFLHFGMSWTILGVIALAIFVMGLLFLTPDQPVSDEITKAAA